MAADGRRRPKGTGSIRERSKGRWQLRVFAGADPVTGRPRLIERTVEARNETDARAKLRKLQADVEAEPRVGTSATVRVAIEEWLAHSEARGRAPRTIHEAKRCAEREIFPALGDVALRDLTPRHLDELYRRLSTGEGRARALAPASVRRYHAILSAALSQSVRWGWIDRNPAERAQPPELGHRALVVPTTDEVKQLLAAAQKRGPQWGMLLGLALATGARRGELCALRWPDIEGDLIRIRRSLYRAGGDRGEKATKGGRERWVAVGPVARVLLEDWRTHCVARAQGAGVDLVADAFVVSPMPDGSRPVNPDTLSSVVHELCADLWIPHVHLHSLRHYAATELIGAGVNPRDAAELLGHVDPALTLRVYAHATAERQRQAADVLGRALMPAE